MEQTKNLKKDFIWNLVGTTLNAFTSLFYMMIVARINGLEDSGIFSYAFSFACLMLTVASYAGRVYQVTDNSDESTDKDYIAQRFIFSVIAMLISIAYGLYKRIDSYTFTVTNVLCFCKCIEAYGDVLCGILQRNDNLYQAGISLTIKFVLAVGLFIALDLLTGNMLIASIFMTLGWIIVTLLYDVPKTQKYVKGQHVDVVRVINLTIKGFSSFGVLFLTTFLVNATKYVMHGKITPEQQGIFGMIFMPASMLTLCVQYILQPYLKELSTLYRNKNEIEFRKMARLLMLATGGIGIIFLFGMTLFGVPVLSIVYNTDLSSYIFLLCIVIFGAVFYSLSNIVSGVLTTLRIMKEQLISSCLACISEVVLATILIHKYLLLGATVSYCLTMIILCLLYVFLYIRKVHEKFNI